VNSTLSDTYDMEATAEVFSPDLKQLFTRTVTIDVVRGNSSQLAVDIPASAWSGSAQFYFVRLTLGKGDGVTVSKNFYWIPSSLTVFDWAKTTYINTPAKTPAVMTELRKLSPARVDAKVEIEGDAVLVHIANPSKGLAFQLQVEALDDSGNLIPMMLWNENFIELMPGDSSVLSAGIPSSYRGRTMNVRLSGWNVVPTEQSVNLKLRPVAR
jgi:exo-1,4-beta-D-glucosaminidase